MGLHHCWSKTVCALDLELLRLLAPPRHASGLRLHSKVNKVSEIGLELGGGGTDELAGGGVGLL